MKRFFFTDSRERLVAYSPRFGSSEATHLHSTGKTIWLVDGRVFLKCQDRSQRMHSHCEMGARLVVDKLPEIAPD